MSGSDAAIIVFGAAVRADGRPSASLARRIGYAARAAAAEPGAVILCSGAVGRHGPSEASVIARGLAAAGVDPQRLVLDEVSRDTLQTVRTAVRFLRTGGATRCIVVSDRYHLPRIRALMRLLGVATEAGPLAAGRGGAGRAHWTYMRLREAAALPYDATLVLLQRRRFLAEG